MKMTPEEHEAYVEYMDENFDEYEDIIVPETFWGEIVYLYYIFKDMLVTRKDIKYKFWLLRRQLVFLEDGSALSIMFLLKKLIRLEIFVKNSKFLC